MPGFCGSPSEGCISSRLAGFSLFVQISSYTYTSLDPLHDIFIKNLLDDQVSVCSCLYVALRVFVWFSVCVYLCDCVHTCMCASCQNDFAFLKGICVSVGMFVCAYM